MVNVGDSRMIKDQVLEEKAFYVNRALLKQYADASGDQNPIHQDEAFAKSVGLPDVIAHGMLTMGLVAKYVSEIAGGSAKVLEFGGRFTKPVIVPAGADVDVTVTATVTDVVDGKASLSLSATSAGVKVLGMAKAVVAL
ncbi:MAG: MaoC/PaaZ C-terminal domain-containing protein [Candidatus Planktophila sp.]